MVYFTTHRLVFPRQRTPIIEQSTPLDTQHALVWGSAIVPFPAFLVGDAPIREKWIVCFTHLSWHVPILKGACRTCPLVRGPCAVREIECRRLIKSVELRGCR